MVLLDGASLSQQLLSDLTSEIKNRKLKIKLAIILVGDDPPSLKYTHLKQQRAREIGIDCQLHHLSGDVSQANLLALVNQLNSDSTINGIMIQLPLPPYLDKRSILDSIAPSKDIDGLTVGSPFVPATPLGVVRLLEKHRIGFAGKNIVIINDSLLIGQPLKKLFEDGGGIVTLCNDQTVDLPSVTQTADILISATGVKHLITPDHVKSGAVVIDIGGGDVDFQEVKDKCSFITPTFGGVGPMTIASLLTNLVSTCGKLSYGPAS